jgi:DNA helicase IV
LRETREVRVALNLAWFPLSAKRLVDDLFTKPHRLATLAPELSDAERALLARDKFAPWTPADIPLLDEAAELLGTDPTVQMAEEKRQAQARAEALEYAREAISAGTAAGGMIPVSAATLAARFAESGPTTTTAQRAAADRTWTYGHIVVDEAQELSAMDWRMLLRRVPTRSMTIVGDIAQTSSAAGVRDWATALDPVLHNSWRKAELTVSYRTPAEVTQAATAFAAAVGLPMSPLTAARQVPGSLRDVTTTKSELLPTAFQVLKDEAAKYAATDGSGQVALIVSANRYAEAAAGFCDFAKSNPHLAVLAQPTGDRDAQISLLTPAQAKGLEFDAVVLLEPLEIAELDPALPALDSETSSGRNVGYSHVNLLAASDLLVAMTRPTQQLVVVHALPLPPGFTATP